MAIRVPGYRQALRKKRVFAAPKKNVAAMLSLTAMVDMFTVLTIFLLQNYNPETGAVLDIPSEVELPQARVSSELKPSHVITVTKEQVALGEVTLAKVKSIKGTEYWLIRPLHDQLKIAIEEARLEQKSAIGKKFEETVREAKALPKKDDENFRKVTVQADKDVDYEIVKKVMYTVTEAGAGEISFAVLRRAADI